ncbi:MAG: hypothetical protein HYX47_09315 [Burkholderiales bacterium]|nr:hypothetical protein [Burkholderiales bacterium]
MSTSSTTPDPDLPPGGKNGLTWDNGKRQQPGNRGEGDSSPPAGHEAEDGTRGDKAGWKQEQDEATEGKP